MNETEKFFDQNHVLTITPTNIQNSANENVLITKNNVQYKTDPKKTGYFAYMNDFNNSPYSTF